MRIRRIFISKRLVKLAIFTFCFISFIFISTRSNKVGIINGVSQKARNKVSGHGNIIIDESKIFNRYPRFNSSYDIMDDMRDSFNIDQMGKRPKACFVTLVRNSEIDDLLTSIGYIREKFNKKFNYPWVFLNDEEFTDEFKNKVLSMLNSTVEFGLVPKEHWSYPEYIDEEKAAQTRIDMAEIIYGDSESYRNMCRYQSGFFWRHELLMKYDWYWRVEPGIAYFCDILEDPFQFMQDNQKVYGFTISIHEFESTIPTLWETTKNFVSNHTNLINSDNLLKFVSDDNGETYNMCHFWSNFEIGNLNFWRSKAYTEYFDYLDRAGGFFYERWGDAPVHSIAASLLLPKKAIHFFPTISYYHGPYTNCPIDNDIFKNYNCECDQNEDFTFQDYSCGVQYHDAQGIEKPKDWKKHTG